MIEEILAILEERKNKKKNVLVVVFGSFHNREEIHLLLTKYRDQCNYSFLFSDSSLKYAGDSFWQGLGTKVEGENLLAENQLAEFELVLLPLLTRNSLAKLVAGIADTTPLTIVQLLFLMGKTILVSDHSYKTTTDYAIYRGFDQNPNYDRLIESQEQQLIQLGAKIGTLGRFKDLFVEEMSVNKSEILYSSQQQDSKKLWTLTDVKAAPFTEFDSSVRMTDLAREFLEEKRIKE